MDIGICLPQLGSHCDGTRVADFASTAEKLGYEALWVGDRALTPLHPKDLYPVGGTPECPYPPEFTAALDPLLTLTAAAVATNTIRLGTSTLNATWHNPVLLARALTSLDSISDGRLLLGLGLGWMRDEYHALGIPWTGKSERLEETLDVLHTMWRQNPVEHHGALFDIPRSAVDLRPTQTGGPQILLAGFTDVAMRRIGRRASGWINLWDMPQEYIDFLWSIARTAADDAGRDPNALRRETRVNVVPGQSIRDLTLIVEALSERGVDGMFFDLHYSTRTVDQAIRTAASISEELGLVSDYSGDTQPALRSAQWT